MHPSHFRGELVTHTVDTSIHNVQVRSIVCHAFSKLCVCKCMCTCVVFFSVEPADESCHIKDKGRNQFYWSRQFILLGLPNVYRIPTLTGLSLVFATN